VSYTVPAANLEENARQLCRAAAKGGLCMHGKSGACWPQ
jgi:hypothetical protein